MALSSPPHIHVGVVDLEVDVASAKADHMVWVLVEVVTGPIMDPTLPDYMMSGIPSFCLSPSINLFTNFLNFLGMEWVEKLKNLTITVQTMVDYTPIYAILLDEPPLALGLVLSDEEVKSPPLPSESSDLGYFLWPSTKGNNGGLGLYYPAGSRGRGWRYHIVKA